jgi:hypothetical protein
LYRKATPAAELQECALVKSLRKVLFLHAAVWGVVGLICGLFPQSVLNVLSNTTPIPGLYFQIQPAAPPGAIFVRLVGVQSFVLAMFMVLVAQKIEALWWWSWAFVLADVVLAAVALVHVLFGLPPQAATLWWWIAVAVCLGLAAALLWGLFKAAQDQPIIDA